MRPAVFKIITRTLIILIAAGLVCAGLYLAAGSQSASSAPFEGGRHFDRGVPPGGFNEQALSEFGEHGGHDQVNVLGGLAGMSGNLLVIAAVTAGVAMVQKIFSRRPRRTKPQPPAGSPQ